MSKQTAVEWLIEQLKEHGYIGGHFLNTGEFPPHLLIDQAKAMEREQLKEMYLKGIENYDPTFKRKEQ